MRFHFFQTAVSGVKVRELQEVDCLEEVESVLPNALLVIDSRYVKATCEMTSALSPDPDSHCVRSAGISPCRCFPEKRAKHKS